MRPLHDLGANEVIPEEYETSIEIFSRVLSRCEVSRDKIESFIDQIRRMATRCSGATLEQPYCSANLSLMTEDISTPQGRPGLCRG